MKRPETRHYSEEELLLHIIGEVAPEIRAEISAHLMGCPECRSILQEYAALVKSFGTWSVPELSEESWQSSKARLMTQFRQDREWIRRKGLLWYMRWGALKGWDYAMENPLPTMGYIAAAIAFASERTITIFRLDWILPATGEVFRILRQVL
jgi:anti-sigma factor RsiW